MNYRFPKDFLWGVGGSAFQMEGAMLEDGKTMNIREASFFSTEGPREKFLDPRSPEVGADFYHKYPEDIKLMGQLGPKVFRYSIAWARIIPSMNAEPNRKAIDYYNKVIDAMIAEGITPFMDLYHADLPMWVIDEGGIVDDRFVEWYTRYVSVCFQEFGDRVKYWSTVNEPMLMVFSPYSSARCVPFIKDQAQAFKATHNMILAHFSAVRALREISPDGKIGMVNNFCEVFSMNHDPEDVEACERRVEMYLTFADPIILGEYPKRTREYVNSGKYITPQMQQEIKENFAPMDFAGFNIYCPKFAKNDPEKLFGNVPISVDLPKDAYGFVSYADCIFDSLVRLTERYGKFPFFITENGYTQLREPGTMELESFRHDKVRIDYIREHVRACARALKAGVNLKGYFYWSFMDSWEVQRGFNVPMGLVGVNFDTLERQPRDSFYYYQRVMAENTVD